MADKNIRRNDLKTNSKRNVASKRMLKTDEWWEYKDIGLTDKTDRPMIHKLIWLLRYIV